MLTRLLRRLAPPLPHPIDQELRIDTSGTIGARWLFGGDAFLRRSSTGYVGSQPTVVHEAIMAIEDVADCDTFVDLGCGKGRALVEAGLMSFHRLIGIELSISMAKIARENIARLKDRDIPMIEAECDIIVGDASAPDLNGTGSTILYLYNPFGEGPMRNLLQRLKTHVADNPDQKIWLVYCNPVLADMVDEYEATFDRFFADRIAFSEEEVAHHPFDNRSDSVVIWQSRSGEMYAPSPGYDRKVVVTIPGRGADVAL